MEKMTKREMYQAIMTKVADNEGMVAFIKHEIELLDNHKANKKPSKTQEQNVAVKVEILATLSTANMPLTVTEMMNANPMLSANAGMSNQKISALLRQLIESGEVTKATDGKKSVFSAVE